VVSEATDPHSVDGDRAARPWVFIGAVLVEIAVLVSLWAFGKYFGS
jgi:uncharacterized BrkB/YihY/UPF0761 family membrane protein